MVHPDDADEQEAHAVAGERRPLQKELVREPAIGDLAFEEQERDGDCKDTIAKRFALACGHHPLGSAEHRSSQGVLSPEHSGVMQSTYVAGDNNKTP